MESTTHLDLDSGTHFDASITRGKLDSSVELPSELQISRGRASTAACMMLYSTRIASFICGIMSAKEMLEVWPAVFVEESSTQLLIYSLDTGIRLENQ